MRDFSGIVDLPAFFMIVGALFVIALANGFSLKRSVAMAQGMLLEVALLFMLVSIVPLFEDPLNFMTLPYVASFALVTFALAGFVTISLSVVATPPSTADARPKLGFRIAGFFALVAGVGYLAIGHSSLNVYFQMPAVIFVAVVLFWIGLLARFSGAGSVVQSLSNALPSVAILGMVVGIAAAVLDVYEAQFLLPLLGFGVNVVFLAIFLRLLMQLVGWSSARLDSVRFLALACLLSVALGLVLMAQALG
jgi:hypothetical protein